MKSNGKPRVNGKTPRCGRRRERRWTPTRAKAQDTRASPNSLETHIVRKLWGIGHLRAHSPWSNGWMEGAIASFRLRLCLILQFYDVVVIRFNSEIMVIVVPITLHTTKPCWRQEAFLSL